MIKWLCLLRLIKAWKNLEHLSACKRYLFLMSWATFLDSAFLSRITWPLVWLTCMRRDESRGFYWRELSNLLYSASACSTRLAMWLNSCLKRSFKGALRVFSLLQTLNMQHPETWWLQPSETMLRKFRWSTISLLNLKGELPLGTNTFVVTTKGAWSEIDSNPTTLQEEFSKELSHSWLQKARSKLLQTLPLVQVYMDPWLLRFPSPSSKQQSAKSCIS